MEKKQPRKPLSQPEQRKLEFKRLNYYVEKEGFWTRNPAMVRIDKSIDFESDTVTFKKFPSFDAAAEYEEHMIRERVPGRNNWEIRGMDFEETVIDQHQEVQETLGEVSENLREHIAPKVEETNENMKKLLAFQEGGAKEAIEITQRREVLAEKRKAQNEAFASRVEAGDATPLEQKKLRLKILAEEIRKQEADAKLEKQREKMRKQTEKEEKAAAAAARKAASAPAHPPKRRASKLTTMGDAPANPTDYPTIDSPEMATFVETFAEFQHGTEGPARGIFKIPAARVLEMCSLSGADCDELSKRLLEIPTYAPGDAIVKGRPGWISGDHAAVGGAGVHRKPHETMFAQSAPLEDGVFTNVYGGGSVERFASTCIVEDVSPSLLKIMTRLSDALERCGLPPINTALLRKYITGQDGIGWHSDAVTNFHRLGLLTIMRLFGERRLQVRDDANNLIFDEVLQPFDIVIMLLHTNLVTHCVMKEGGVVGVSGSASFRSVTDVMTCEELLERLQGLAQSRNKKRQLAPRSTARSAASTSAGETSPSSVDSRLPAFCLTPARELTITADTLNEILQPLGVVDETGRLTRLGRRSITLKEALLAPALLRNIKKYEMRKKRNPAGPFLVHVGAGTKQDYKDMLDQQWPAHPAFGDSPQKAVYGWMGLEESVAAEGLNDPWAHCGKWGQRVAWSIEFGQPVPNVAGSRGVWYLEDETLTAAVERALIGATFRTSPVDSP